MALYFAFDSGNGWFYTDCESNALRTLCLFESFEADLSKNSWIAAGFAILVLGCLLGLVASNIGRALYNEFVLDSKDHFKSCQELPSKSAVLQVMQVHRDTIEEIERVNPGFVSVNMDAEKCAYAATADIVIEYGTHRDRVAIERIIGDNIFFGIPYRLINR